MPTVRVEIWKGKSPEVKQALADALTQAVVTNVGCPPMAVTVIINEIEKSHWFTGGKDADALFPGVS